MADDQLQQLTLVYLFGAVYVYLDWYYDDSSIRGAKLVIALFATVPAVVTLVQLARMGPYFFFFLLNRTVDTLSLGTVMPLYSHYQETYGKLKNLGADDIGLKEIMLFPLPNEGKWWSNIKYFFLHYCAGSWDGQCRVVRTSSSDVFNDYFLKKQEFGRRKYFEITEAYNRDFAHTSLDKDWKIQQSNDVMTRPRLHPNDPADITKYCFFIVRVDITYSYTIVRDGGVFCMPVLKRNDPNRVEHQYGTVFCLSDDINSTHHLHLPLSGERRWIVCQNCQNCNPYDTYFRYLTLLSDHYGDFLNLTRLVI